MGELLHYLSRVEMAAYRAGLLAGEPVHEPVEDDLTGLAFHLADLAGDDWRHLTEARRAQLRTIAEFAQAAAVETKRHGHV